MAPAGSSVAERDDPCCAVAKQNLSGRASETEKGPSQGALFRFTVSPDETSGTPDDVGYDPGFHTWSGQCRAANVKSWSVVSNCSSWRMQSRASNASIVPT